MMGSLQISIPLKRNPLLRPASSSKSFFHRPRSRLARFLLFKKIDYLQWLLFALAFFFVLVLFQNFLPGSVIEENEKGIGEKVRVLDFGEGIWFEPRRSWERERREENGTRFGVRRPKIALVVADLSAHGAQLEMISVAAVLKEIGYDIQVFSLNDGPVQTAWRSLGMALHVLPMDVKCEMAVDWLDYNGMIASSLGARPVISCLLQEPFRSIPVIWIIHEKSLAFRLSKYAANGQSQLISDWKQYFNRATVVFPTHSLTMMYSAFDVGNYFVIPSSASESWRASNLLSLQNGHNLRVKMGYRSKDFIIAIVGSQFSYSGMWLEYSLVLQALAPVLNELASENTFTSLPKVGVLSGNSSATYKTALQTVALNLGFPGGSMQMIDRDTDEINFLGICDLVIYGSFLKEQSFPPVLLHAMNLGKLVVAPDLDMIKRYVDDKVNGFLYSKEDVGMLKHIFLQAVSSGGLSPLAQKIASAGREHARNLMVSDTMHSYASLLKNVSWLSSEIAYPKAVADISSRLKEEWQWHLFENLTDVRSLNKGSTSNGILDKIEEQWNYTHNEASANITLRMDEAFSLIAWEEEKMLEVLSARKRLEEQELKDRTDQTHSTWEEVYRNVKKADRVKNELHERDDMELERIGQPLCIYEPYFGEGTWPFLHNTSLYRGISLSSEGRRHGSDDIDASSRLPLLVDAYYRDALGEHGAFFALANQIDRIHKNAWIGFQSWRAVARKESLSRRAEAALIEAIQGRKHGDTLYFWVCMEKDPRNPLQQDFWSFCDTINAGNCRSAVSEALQRMYGVNVEHNWDTLPKMPKDGDSWSVMHSWALPTRSFLEFVMFSRMFVDTVDAQMYDDHQRSGHCHLSLSKDPHCYSRVLELLVNVWAYHSARRMIYLNPETGVMREHHKLKSRRGQMWIKWFSYATLKSMDEDLAEQYDSDSPRRRWLWPLTGEVFWQGMYERERNMHRQQKERRKQENRDKIERIKRRARQKTIGKYIKPPPEGNGHLNSTITH